MKYDPTGQALLYSSYLGGSSADTALDVTVDGEGNVYLTGSTGSKEFLTVNAAQSELANADGLGQDAFVTKLTPDGATVLYSTLFGGSGIDLGQSIAVGADGSAYIAGETDSADLPVEGAFQPSNGGGNDAFVMKLDPTGATVDYATYIGGSEADGASGVAVDAAGNAYVAGVAFSPDFPVTIGAFQTSSASESESFIAKLAPGEPPAVMTSVSAASFSRLSGLAPDSLATGFGVGLATGTAVATETPLPTELAGTSVEITDSAGVQHLAQL
ncbi:MAG: hypothetical protein GY953_18675, partial [bacterium]|nr:hypothetical protein [bacterium]